MFKETLNGNLITIEHWPSSTIEIKGKFSRSFDSLCNRSMRSLSKLNSLSIVNSFSSLSDDIPENLSNSSQESLLDIIEEEE